jgi:hypothetical protein
VTGPSSQTSARTEAVFIPEDEHSDTCEAVQIRHMSDELRQYENIKIVCAALLLNRDLKVEPYISIDRIRRKAEKAKEDFAALRILADQLTTIVNRLHKSERLEYEKNYKAAIQKSLKLDSE